MADEYRSAVLRGFDTAVADVGDQLHLCHPLLSFEGDPALYVARRLNWRNDPKALVVADPSEASDLGTLLPNTHAQAIASGEAVAVVGTGFVQTATAAGIHLDGSEMALEMVGDAECRISVATPERFAKLRTRLADEARTAFDEELGEAAHGRRRLSERGNAALLLLRRCGPYRRDDLAIRQLAGARQNREFDLYRRLLVRFALELRTQENDLDRKAERHIELAMSTLRRTTLDLSPGQKDGDLLEFPAGTVMESIRPAFEKFSYDLVFSPSHKKYLSKFPPVVNFKEELGATSMAMVLLRGGGFWEGIQRNSEGKRFISAQPKKLTSETLKVSVSFSRSLKKLPSGLSLLTSEPLNRVMIPTGEAKSVSIS